MQFRCIVGGSGLDPWPFIRQNYENLHRDLYQAEQHRVQAFILHSAFNRMVDAQWMKRHCKQKKKERRA